MDGYLVFVNTDNEGNITEARMGISPIPNKKFTFFFFMDEEPEREITDYRVVIEGYETSLELKNTG